MRFNERTHEIKHIHSIKPVIGCEFITVVSVAHVKVSVELIPLPIRIEVFCSYHSRSFRLCLRDLEASRAKLLEHLLWIVLGRGVFQLLHILRPIARQRILALVRVVHVDPV